MKGVMVSWSRVKSARALQKRRVAFLVRRRLAGGVAMWRQRAVGKLTDGEPLITPLFSHEPHTQHACYVRRKEYDRKYSMSAVSTLHLTRCTHPQFKQLGNSGLRVSKFSLGGWLTYVSSVFDT